MSRGVPPSSSARAHALVIGASIGALCAAEVLARSFERVTLIERDVLNELPEPRRGVPQGTQPHGVLARGRVEIERLFPGLLHGLVAQGAVELDASLQAARYLPKQRGWAPRHPGLYTPAFACTRPLLELGMRRSLMARRPNVRIVDGTRVTGLAVEQRAGELWVTGVRTDAVDPALRELAADLVVDASGRGTKVYKWLSELGLPEPEELRVDAQGNYATRFYRAPAEAERWFWRSVLIDNEPPHFRRACAILAVEGGRWMVTAAGINQDYAPSDEAGWLAFIKSTRSPVIHELLQRAEPLGEIAQSRTTVNRWRQLHRDRAPVHGLLSFADAVCSYNPIYGQGVTAAALAAGSLETELARHHGAFNRAFLTRCYGSQAKFLHEGWAFSTTLDLRWPGTLGARSALSSLLGGLADMLQEVAIHDPRLLRKLLPFSDFGARRSSLLAPDFMFGVLAALLRQRYDPPRLEPQIDLSQPLEELLALNARAQSSGLAPPVWSRS